MEDYSCPTIITDWFPHFVIARPEGPWQSPFPQCTNGGFPGRGGDPPPANIYRVNVGISAGNNRIPPYSDGVLFAENPGGHWPPYLRRM